MSSKAQKLIGVARINEFFDHNWRGFTLQRGHFFGQLKNGVYFVSGLEKREKDGKIKVYMATPTIYSDEYVWKPYWADPSSEVVQVLLKAVPRRNKMGITKVEFKKLKDQKSGYNPQLVTSKIVPYAPMRIPCPGTGTYSHIVNAK